MNADRIVEQAAIGYGVSEHAAIKNACRSAVGQACNVIVEAETVVVDGETEKDVQISATNGFLKSYRLVNSKVGKDNQWTAKVVAKVYIYDQSVRPPEQGEEEVNIKERAEAAAIVGRSRGKEKESNGKWADHNSREWVDLMFYFANQYAKSLSVKLLDVDTNGRDTFNLSYRVGVRPDQYLEFIKVLENKIRLMGVRRIPQENYPVLEAFYPYDLIDVKWYIPSDVGIFNQMAGKSSGGGLAQYEVCILLKGEFDEDTGEREILKETYIPLPEDLAPTVSDGKLRLGPNLKKTKENFARHPNEGNRYWLDEKNDIDITVPADVFEKVEVVSIQIVPAAKRLGKGK